MLSVKLWYDVGGGRGKKGGRGLPAADREKRGSSVCKTLAMGGKKKSREGRRGSLILFTGEGRGGMKPLLNTGKKEESY